MESAGPGRVAVVDRGEGALRVLRAVHELARTGQAAVAVAIHPAGEHLSRFARDADEAVEWPEGDPAGALRAARAESAWLGPASLAERTSFAEACARAGVRHLGPDHATLLAVTEPGGLERLASRLGVAACAASRAGSGARLVEVVVVRSRSGETRTVGVGEASLRRDGVAVLVEAPSPALDAVADESARRLALAAAGLTGWIGVCAVQLVYDPAAATFALCGIDAFAHASPAIEALAGVDLVRLSLCAALGATLGEGRPALGHAFAGRIQAQDPDTGPVADAGTVELLRLPSGLGVRSDLALSQGDRAPAGDGTVATLVARGESRSEALARLEQALADGDVLLTRSGSSKGWLAALCARPEVQEGRTGAGLLASLTAPGERLARPAREPALLAASVQSYHAQLELERARFVAEARRGRPRVGPSSGRLVELLYRFHAYRLDVRQTGPRTYRVVPGGSGTPVDVTVERLGMHERRLVWQGRRYRILSASEGNRLLVLVDGVAHALVRDPSGVVVSPMPAVVVALPVRPGQRVAAGEPVARIESMKVEVEVKSPSEGVVRELLAVVNGQVDAGAPLLRLDPVGGELRPETEPATAEPLALGPDSALPTEPRERYLAALSELTQLLLGFDVGKPEAKKLASGWQATAGAVPVSDPAALSAEEEALAAFADVQSLFSRAHRADEKPALEELWRYMHEPEARGEGLSPWFVEELGRALARYGVALDAPGRALELALLRIQKAHERVGEALPPVLAILERRLGNGAPPGFDAPASRGLLQQLAELGQERFPSLADLAQEVSYRRFDQPTLERGRAEAYARAEADLARLPSAKATEQDELVARLVACTQPLATLLVSRMAGASPQVRGRLVEVTLRRYYRFRPLGPVRLAQAGEAVVAETEYRRDGTTFHLLGCAGPLAGVEGLVRELARRASGVEEGREVVLELYLWQDGEAAGDEALAARLSAALAQGGFARPVRRASLAVASADSGQHHEPVGQHFAFRGGPGEWQEERRLRGIHFMLAERLQFGRLARFELTRLPSVRDVYLFHAVAQGNPKDERLFAMAEVRDLTAVRDAAGRVVQLPYVERMLHEALAGMRVFQARRPPGQRLEWNRVLLTVTPPLLLSHEEVRGLAERLVPATVGLGLEMLLLTARVPSSTTGELEETLLRVITTGNEVSLRWDPPTDRPLEPMAEYQQKVVQLRRRGLTHPFEVVRVLAPPEGVRSPLPPGEFAEYDLDEANALVPVERPPGRNTANVVVGVVTNFTDRYPEGMRRVIVLGDPGREMGSVAEPECRRILAGLALAERLGLPFEWFEVCAGAKNLHDHRHREHGLGLQGAPQADRVHPGWGRGERGGDGHHRRRPALLERRGHHAHAHQGHPGDGDRLVAWCSPESRPSTTRGASRQRTTKASAATTASWGRTARRSTRPPAPARRARSCCATTSTATAHPASASPVRPPPPTLANATCAPTRTAPRAAPASPPWVTSSAPSATPTARSRSRSATSWPPVRIRTTSPWSAGATCAAGTPPWSGTPTWAAGRCASSASSRGRCRAWSSYRPMGPSTGRRAPSSRSRRRRSPGRSTRRAACGRWWSWRTSPASTVRPSRCGACSWSTARRSAGRW